MDRAEQAINYIRDNAKEFAKAKAKRVQLQEFRKSKLAILFNSAPPNCETIAERENYARAHDDYLELLEGLAAATETEEEIRWKMEAAKMRFEQYRTEHADQRAERGRYAA